MKPKNRTLIEKARKAHFNHFLGTDFGLTYQSCRFCRTDARDNEDSEHGACTIARDDRHCRGLWKYAVRHYLCSDCRKDLLLGLAPEKNAAPAPAAQKCEP